MNQFFVHKKNIGKKILFCTLLTVALNFFGSQPVQAFGVSPSGIEISNVLPENSVERTIKLSRRDADNAETYTVTVSGNGAQYVHLSSQRVMFATGTTQALFTFNIRPRLAADGDYQAHILFSPVFSSTADSPLVIGIALKNTTRFSVTHKKIISYAARSSAIFLNEQKKPSFSSLIVNTGNSNIKIVRAQVRVQSDENTTDSFSENLPTSVTIPAFGEKSVEFSFSRPLGPGNYSVTVELFWDYTTEPFSQSRQITIPQVVAHASIRSSNYFITTGLGISLGLTAVICLVFFLKSKRQ